MKLNVSDDEDRNCSHVGFERVAEYGQQTQHNEDERTEMKINWKGNLKREPVRGLPRVSRSIL